MLSVAMYFINMVDFAQILFCFCRLTQVSLVASLNKNAFYSSLVKVLLRIYRIEIVSAENDLPQLCKTIVLGLRS